jgi:hypothetical protein
MSYLTLEQVEARLNEIGIPASSHQVRRWAAERRLPVFRLGRRLHISEEALNQAIARMQSEAIVAASKRRH